MNEHIPLPSQDFLTAKTRKGILQLTVFSVVNKSSFIVHDMLYLLNSVVDSLELESSIIAFCKFV